MNELFHEAMTDTANAPERMCVNCGITVPASHDRGQPGPGCKSPDACTFDLTTEEAVQFWRDKAHEAQAVGFAAGVEAAAKACSPHNDDDSLDRQCKAECTTAILALTPPDATAAAARVLLGVWPTDDSFRAAFDACVARYHGGDQMQDEMDRTRATVSAALRAMAGEPQ